MKQIDQQERRKDGSARGLESLRRACKGKRLHTLLLHYLERCRAEEETDEKGRTVGRRFPNVAGFCRSRGIGLSDLDTLSEEYPNEVDLLLTVLEDEALNAGLPPPILSAYLKKRLAYDRVTKEGSPSAPTVCFEHDIFRDGE